MGYPLTGLLTRVYICSGLTPGFHSSLRTSATSPITAPICHTTSNTAQPNHSTQMLSEAEIRESVSNLSEFVGQQNLVDSALRVTSQMMARTEADLRIHAFHLLRLYDDQKKAHRSGVYCPEHRMPAETGDDHDKKEIVNLIENLFKGIKWELYREILQAGQLGR
jgi:hypothetical protein